MSEARVGFVDEAAPVHLVDRVSRVYSHQIHGEIVAGWPSEDDANLDAPGTQFEGLLSQSVALEGVADSDLTSGQHFVRDVIQVGDIVSVQFPAWMLNIQTMPELLETDVTQVTLDQRRRVSTMLWIAREIDHVYGDERAQGWFVTRNRHLDYEVPLRVLRDSATAEDAVASLAPALEKAFE